MIFDKAKWHFEGKFPKELPFSHSYAHIALFLAWVIDQGLESESLRQQFPAELRDIRDRRITASELLHKLDVVLSSEELGDVADAFAREYYLGKDYFKDYARMLAVHLPSVYHVNDTWENYDKLAPVISEKFQKWRTKNTKGQGPREAC